MGLAELFSELLEARVRSVCTGGAPCRGKLVRGVVGVTTFVALDGVRPSVPGDPVFGDGANGAPCLIAAVEPDPGAFALVAV
jgi:hypothetical protein